MVGKIFKTAAKVKGAEMAVDKGTDIIAKKTADKMAQKINVNNEILKYGNFAAKTAETAIGQGTEIYKQANSNAQSNRKAYNDERTSRRVLDVNFGADVDSFNKWDKTERTAETANRVLSTFNVNRRAILWIIIIIAVIYIFFQKKINDIFSNVADIFIENDKQKSVTNKYGQLGLKASELRAMATSIESCWNGAGEDENAVIAHINRLKTRADWEFLKEVYGERPVYGAKILWFSASKIGTYSLESAIASYCSDSDKQAIKNKLQKIKVNSVAF